MGIIIKPIVTEKMTAMGEKYNRYGFRVDPKADKLQIKKAVEEMYNVTVVSVIIVERTRAVIPRRVLFPVERLLIKKP